MSYNIYGAGNVEMEMRINDVQDKTGLGYSRATVYTSSYYTSYMTNYHSVMWRLKKADTVSVWVTSDCDSSW